MQRHVPVPRAFDELDVLESTASATDKEKLIAKTLRYSRFIVSDVTSTIISACDSLKALATAEVSESHRDSLEDIEYEFLADFGTGRLIPLAFISGWKFRCGFKSNIIDKLPNLPIPPVSSGGKTGSVLVKR